MDEDDASLSIPSIVTEINEESSSLEDEENDDDIRRHAMM